MIRTEEEVDKMLDEMVNRTKGAYITQGVSFNKTCPRQMGLLKKALMSSVSFSGLVKEILAVNFNGEQSVVPQPLIIEQPKPVKKKNIGNFL